MDCRRHRAATYHAVGRTNYWLTAPSVPYIIMLLLPATIVMHMI